SRRRGWASHGRHPQPGSHVRRRGRRGRCGLCPPVREAHRGLVPPRGGEEEAAARDGRAAQPRPTSGRKRGRAVITPFAAAGQGLKRAYLAIVAPRNAPDPVIPLCFNPAEYQLQKSNSFADIAIPGLESPPIQFVRGDARKLTTELLADTSDTLEDVREK